MALHDPNAENRATPEQVQTAMAHHEAGHANPHVGSHDSHVHVVPPWLLLSVFGALLALTVITVAVTYVDFGRTINVWLALVIAVVKAALVGLYFMHLRWDSPFNGLVCVAAIFFVALFIGIVVLDTKEYNLNFSPPPVTAARPQP